MISKELLSEVLGIPLGEITKIDNDSNKGYKYIVVYHTELNPKKYMCPYHVESINIHELAFKCKEWLMGKVSNCCSGFDNGGRWFCYIEDKVNIDRFYADTEPEAIFRVCQYILENQNEKSK